MVWPIQIRAPGCTNSLELQFRIPVTRSVRKTRPQCFCYYLFVFVCSQHLDLEPIPAMTLRGQLHEHQGQPSRGSISAEAASTRSRNALSLNFQGYRKPFLPPKVICGTFIVYLYFYPKSDIPSYEIFLAWQYNKSN